MRTTSIRSFCTPCRRSLQPRFASWKLNFPRVQTAGRNSRPFVRSSASSSHGRPMYYAHRHLYGSGLRVTYVAEDLGVLALAEALHRIRAKQREPFGLGEIVPQLFEANGR